MRDPFCKVGALAATEFEEMSFEYSFYISVKVVSNFCSDIAINANFLISPIQINGKLKLQK